MTFPVAPTGHVIGIDTSAAQGALEVPTVAAAGVAFIIGKATDGARSVDPQWAATAARTREAGLVLGAYGVFEPGVDAIAQADHFCDVVTETGGATLLCLDFELAKGLSGAEALTRAATWIEHVEARMAQRVLVYVSPAFILTLLRFAGASGNAAAAKLGARPLWLASWTQDFAKPPTVPRPWSAWSLWQASGGHAVSRNGATLPGTRIDVDVDLFRGTRDDLCALGHATP